jgi:hypothetical protein
MKAILTDEDLLRIVPQMLEEKYWQYFRAVKYPPEKYPPERMSSDKMPETITEDYIFTAKEIIKALWESWQAKVKGDNHVRENVSLRSESVPVVSTEVLAQEDKQDPE